MCPFLEKRITPTFLLSLGLLAIAVLLSHKAEVQGEVGVNFEDGIQDAHVAYGIDGVDRKIELFELAVCIVEEGLDERIVRRFITRRHDGSNGSADELGGLHFEDFFSMMR